MQAEEAKERSNHPASKQTTNWRTNISSKEPKSNDNKETVHQMDANLEFTYYGIDLTFLNLKYFAIIDLIEVAN